MIYLYIYLIIAGLSAIAFFLKSIFNLTKEERKGLTYKDYVGGSLASILIVGLLWPISWVLWFSKDK